MGQVRHERNSTRLHNEFSKGAEVNKTKRLLVVPLVLALAVVSLASCQTRFGSDIERSSDPVVLDGSNAPKLLGADPQHVVGFAYNGKAWHQIPVQVDERDLVSPGQIQHLSPSAYPKLYGASTPYKILVYTPPATQTAGYHSWNTYTPSDSDPTLDSNDEISFLASDTGKSTDADAPAGVDAASRTHLALTDPITGKKGSVYLFTSATLTGGSAGTDGVNYTFSLDSGDYLSTYKIGPSALSPNNANGPNPEHSTVSTPFYNEGFTDRWLNDALSINQAPTPGVDLLDRTKYFATKVACGRTEDTFDATLNYTGEFVANISGPVRAIRSVMGANSFTYIVLTDTFYPNRQDSVIELRGHVGMPGFGSSDDLTTGLAGMTYSDPSNTNVPIDGVADTVTPLTSISGGAQPSTWQMVSGPAGTMLTTHRLDTDIPGLNISSTWKDSSATKDCTGDASSWGQAGFEINSPTNSVPATDPTLVANPPRFTSYRTRYFGGTEFSTTDASALEARANTPIQVTTD